MQFKFGHEAYDIFQTCETQEELETKIIAAFERAKASIEKQTARVNKSMAKVREMSANKS